MKRTPHEPVLFTYSSTGLSLPTRGVLATFFAAVAQTQALVEVVKLPKWSSFVLKSSRSSSGVRESCVGGEGLGEKRAAGAPAAAVA